MVITFFSSNHQNWLIEFDLFSNNSQLVDGFRSKKKARGSKQSLRAALSMAHVSSDTLRHQGRNEPTTKDRSSWRKLTKPVIERRTCKNKSFFFLLTTACDQSALIQNPWSHYQQLIFKMPFTAWRFLCLSHRETEEGPDWDDSSGCLRGFFVFQNIVPAAIKAVTFPLNCSVNNNQRCSWMLSRSLCEKNKPRWSPPIVRYIWCNMANVSAPTTKERKENQPLFPHWFSSARIFQRSRLRRVSLWTTGPTLMERQRSQVGDYECLMKTAIGGIYHGRCWLDLQTCAWGHCCSFVFLGLFSGTSVFTVR